MSSFTSRIVRFVVVSSGGVSQTAYAPGGTTPDGTRWWGVSASGNVRWALSAEKAEEIRSKVHEYVHLDLARFRDSAGNSARPYRGEAAPVTAPLSAPPPPPVVAAPALAPNALAEAEEALRLAAERVALLRAGMPVPASIPTAIPASIPGPRAGVAIPGPRASIPAPKAAPAPARQERVAKERTLAQRGHTLRLMLDGLRAVQRGERGGSLESAQKAVQTATAHYEECALGLGIPPAKVRELIDMYAAESGALPPTTTETASAKEAERIASGGASLAAALGAAEEEAA